MTEILLATKRCTKCFETLPIDRFFKRKARCKKCIAEVRRAYYRAYPEKRWAFKNPGYVKKKVRERLARPVPFCPCGNTEKFHWRSERWICTVCSKLETKRKDRQRRSQKRVFKQRVLKISQIAADLEAKWGSSLRDTFLSRLKLDQFRSIMLHPVNINTVCLPVEWHTSKTKTRERIHLLNRVTNSAPGTVGWSCKVCGIQKSDPCFFDIDHVIPRSKKGGNGIANLQVLCPNCHREKTLIDSETFQKPEPLREGEAQAI